MTVDEANKADSMGMLLLLQKLDMASVDARFTLLAPQPSCMLQPFAHPGLGVSLLKPSGMPWGLLGG